MTLASIKTRILCVALVVFLTATAGLQTALAESWKQIIVKCAPEDLEKIRAAVGGAIVDAIPGHYLINVPSNVDTNRIESIQGKSVIKANDNHSISILPRAPRPAASSTSQTVSSGGIISYYGAPAPRIYTEQPAVFKINLPDALQKATGSGTSVAIVDTGIDFNQPTLAGSVVNGRNYVGRTTLATEFDDPVLTQAQALVFELGQAQARVFDLGQAQATVFELGQAQARVFDLGQAQATVFELAQAQATVFELASLPPMFGHGTMTAGLVHLVAPQAKLVSFKAFDSNGVGTEWNVVRAIYDAVNMNVDIINMSFSSPFKSKMLEAAVEYAESRGVVLVSAAGNDNTETPTYPASLDQVVGVSALTLNDTKAAFSNFGKYIDLGAPGVDLITTYPTTKFAQVSGTSESSPLVAGVFALARQRQVGSETLREKVESAVDPIRESDHRYRQKLGTGRINAAKAVK